MEQCTNCEQLKQRAEQGEDKVSALELCSRETELEITLLRERAEKAEAEVKDQLNGGPKAGREIV